MKNIFRKIVVFILLLGFATPTTVAIAAPAPVAQAAAQDKKKAAAQKAAEKKKKEQVKAKAAKQKEQAKKQAEANKRKAAAAKANEKKRAVAQKEAERQNQERAKAAAEREKETARKQAAQEKAAQEKAEQEQKQKEAYFKQQAELANPKTEVISLINLSGKVGYAAMMDKMTTNYSNVRHLGQLDSDYPYQSLTGGPGAGLSATYELQYGAFRFETGLDFTWLNSRSDYGFTLARGNTYSDDYTTSRQTYLYTTDDLREVRNVGYLGLPIMFGAQFSRYYFMVGAKVGYGLFGTYTQKGRYDITVNDEDLLEPYGLGIYDVPAASNHKLQMKQPSVSICAEVGLDLDEWLQAQPAKKKKRVKAGERLPFGKEYIHYKVSAFAEYGVLNTNSPSGKLPLAFEQGKATATDANSMLSLSGTKLNNLFVGLKFTVQFEIPGKTPRPLPAPASYAEISLLDAANEQPIATSTIEIINQKNGKTALKEKSAAKGALRQRVNVGDYTITAKAQDYYTEDISFSVIEPGSTVPVSIRLRHKPVFRVHVINAESGEAIPAAVQIYERSTSEAGYTLTTDSASGAARTMLDENKQYTLHIEQIGYEPYDATIANIGDSMHIALTPVKKGEVFVMKNMFFATNKTRILSSSEESLEALYMFLERNPEVRIRIMGHTDNVGKEAANQRLSEGRAEAISRDLIKRGIAPERIETIGYGESKPIDTNDTEEGRQNNRRVEIEIL